MGSWSVYCEVSNMAITSGTKCVLLPLKIDNHYGSGTYSAASLPIIGTYNDYGNLENIIKDDNTLLIENYLGISIEEFVTFLVDGKYTFERDTYKLIKDKLDSKILEEIENWRYMFIDYQVYQNFTDNNYSNESYIGDFNMGNDLLLKDIGFNFVEKLDKGLNNLKYEYNNSFFFTNGKGLQNHLGKTYYVLKDLFEDINYTGKYSHYKYLQKIDRYEYLSTTDKYNYIYKIIGCTLSDYIDFKMSLKYPNIIDPLPPKKLHDLYITYNNHYIQRLIGLVKLKSNLYTMSKVFKPSSLYITPQCGDHSGHYEISKVINNILKNKQ